jgi:hypothetical protein
MTYIVTLRLDGEWLNHIEHLRTIVEYDETFELLAVAVERGAPTIGRTCPECGDEVTPGTIGCDR